MLDALPRRTGNARGDEGFAWSRRVAVPQPLVPLVVGWCSLAVGAQFPLGAWSRLGGWIGFLRRAVQVRTGQAMATRRWNPGQDRSLQSASRTASLAFS